MGMDADGAACAVDVDVDADVDADVNVDVDVADLATGVPTCIASMSCVNAGIGTLSCCVRVVVVAVVVVVVLRLAGADVMGLA